MPAIAVCLLSPKASACYWVCVVWAFTKKMENLREGKAGLKKSAES